MNCRRAGAGEYGEKVVLDKSLDSAVKDSITEFGFNIVASDRISLDRAPKDLRHDEYVCVDLVFCDRPRRKLFVLILFFVINVN